jgi:O-antigen ligase
VAKWELKERDTYLTFGVYTALLPLYAASVPSQLQRLRSWALALLCIWAVFSTAALVGESARFGTKETLHEIEYLVISGFFFLYYAVRSRSIKLLAIAMLLAAAVLNQKLTGYIIAAMAVLHIVVAAGWRRLLPQWRWPYVMGAAVFTLAVVAVLTLLYFEFRQHLPSGNVEVRMKQYEAAMRQFFDSPIWGSAYTAGSGEAYRESFRVLNIPTHSDVLDILKHGGLIGFALFVWGYWKIFALVNRAVTATKGDALLNAYFVAVRFFQVAALVVFSLNPLLLKGPFLIVIWGNLGLAVGMALAATRGTADRARA